MCFYISKAMCTNGTRRNALLRQAFGSYIKKYTPLCCLTAEHHMICYIMQGPLSPYQKYYYVTKNYKSIVLIIDFPISDIRPNIRYQISEWEI